MADERIFRCRDLSRVRDVFVLAFQAAKLFTEAFEIVIRPLKAKRSGDQNRRYWALLREVAATVWVDGRQYSDEVWHEHFKRELIGREEIALPSGEVEVRGISTTTLSVGDMGTYMDGIARWCIDTGFPLDEAA
jgi:hypothetical protein